MQTICADISWVDEFIGNVRPYIFVREEDNLLIRMPNQAHRLNAPGVRVLKYLLDGGDSAGLMRSLKENPQRRSEVMLFLHEVRRCLEGRLDESSASSAVDVQPLTLGFSKLPVLSELALTARCNLRCAFCYYGLGSEGGRSSGCSPTGNAPAIKKNEMTTADAVRALKIIFEEARTPSVSFTGGEPTLRRDLPCLVEQAREIGLRVNLITNGTRVDRQLAAALAGAGLNSAQVSLEGATAAVHDAITGVPGSHALSRAGATNLMAAGIHVHTNTTLNRWNLSEAADMPRFVAEELGFERFSMNLVIPSGSAGDRRGLLVSYTEVGPVVERVHSASREQGVEFMWYSPTPVCIFNPIPRGLGNKGCAACDGLLSIDCNGDVLPCSSWPEPVGNILNEGFDRIWNSSRAAALRYKSEAHPSCRECDSFAVCHGACPLYWSSFGFQELEDRFRESDFHPGKVAAIGGGARP